MDAIYWHDGQWTTDNPKLLGPADHAFWMASMVFDGARAFRGLTPDLDLHCQRVVRSAEKMLMKPQLGWEAIQDLCLQAVAKFPEGTELYIKPMFYCADGFLLPTPTAPNSCCMFQGADARRTGLLGLLLQLRALLVQHGAHRRQGVLPVPNGQRAIRDAANRGFDNAIMLDGDGNIAEFATSNLWIAKNGVVSTPVDNGTFLNGITRRRVLALLGRRRRSAGAQPDARRRGIGRRGVLLGQLRQGGARQPRRGPRAGIRPAGAPRPQALHGLRGKHAQALTPHPPRAAAPAGRLHVEQTRLPAHRRRARGRRRRARPVSAAIRRALAIEPDRRSGTLRDVEHIVVLMQENRSFDHYFGGLAGVRGFGDRFPIPVPASPEHERRSVWSQYNDSTDGGPRTVLPFRLDTRAAFEAMRIASTPHTWSNAQQAWDDGRMGFWPAAKKNHSMAYYAEADLPFQYALRAFTVCDAYHCSFTGGTNVNRLFLWTGTNDGAGRGHGPAMGNTYNKLTGGDPAGAYTWTTYPERLERAGIRWRIYQDMADNYALNPTAGFKAYRDAYQGLPGSLAALRERR